MKRKFYTSLFLFLELILYILILTTGGDLLRWSSYISIILCFVYALAGLRRENLLLVGGLFFTVWADLCLVVLQPIQQLWGMVFFASVQVCYCRYLHRNAPNKPSLVIRFVLSMIAIVVCFAVLGNKTDGLAVISVFYYVHLIMNIVDAVIKRKAEPLLPIAFILFILCDTVIGLQVMSGGYLPIAEASMYIRSCSVILILPGFSICQARFSSRCNPASPDRIGRFHMQKCPRSHYTPGTNIFIAVSKGSSQSISRQ